MTAPAIHISGALHVAENLPIDWFEITVTAGGGERIARPFRCRENIFAQVDCGAAMCGPS